MNDFIGTWKMRNKLIAVVTSNGEDCTCYGTIQIPAAGMVVPSYWDRETGNSPTNRNFDLIEKIEGPGIDKRKG